MKIRSPFAKLVKEQFELSPAVQRLYRHGISAEIYRDGTKLLGLEDDVAKLDDLDRRITELWIEHDNFKKSAGALHEQGREAILKDRQRMDDIEAIQQALVKEGVEYKLRLDSIERRISRATVSRDGIIRSEKCDCQGCIEDRAKREAVPLTPAQECRRLQKELDDVPDMVAGMKILRALRSWFLPVRDMGPSFNYGLASIREKYERLANMDAVQALAKAGYISANEACEEIRVLGDIDFPLSNLGEHMDRWREENR